MRYESYLKIFFSFLIAFNVDIAFGQRGGSYANDQQQNWDSASAGFPGYYDANVVEEGHFVVEFPPVIWGIIPTPFMAVDYGVTKTFTVGTNAIFSTVPWLLQSKGGAVKLRSLLYGTESHQSAGTYYTGFLSGNSSLDLVAYYHNVTWNHAYKFSNRQVVYGHLNYLKINAEYKETTDLDHTLVHVSTLNAGGGYEFQYSNAWSYRADLLGAVYQDVEADSTSATVSLNTDLSKTKSVSAILTLQAQYNSSDNWLMGFGATGIAFGGTATGAPWFTIARKW